MLFLIILGYFTMLKCCLYGTFACIAAPFLLLAVRRQRRPNWVPAAPNFLKKLVKQKFNPE